MYLKDVNEYITFPMHIQNILTYESYEKVWREFQFFILDS